LPKASYATNAVVIIKNIMMAKYGSAIVLKSLQISKNQ